MAKALRVIGTVAGVVATVATIVGNPLVAAIAAVVAVAANLGAQALTKPPPARGSVTRLLIQADAPQPYAMGEGLTAGALRHDTAYGPTLDKIPNPYRFMAIVYSGGGPIESIAPWVNDGAWSAIPSWYNGFLFTDTQLGATPEATSLSPQWSGAPNWGPDYKLSGQAAIGWSFLFDKEGKRFASGIPPIAAYGQWVKVYDPRLDSTQPGGSGSHRIDDESTFEWSENVALHAAMYAYGRYQNGKRTFGIGLPADGIDWAVVMAWANVCDANNWTIFGVIYEPADRWQNLKDICFAGGAEPVAGGKLSFKYSAPVVALDTITIDDLTDDERSVTTMQSYRDRLNTVIPKYISPNHNWEMVDAEPVVNATFLAEDGEEKRDVWPFNFVKNVTQATQLAAYRLFDTREIAPITLTCKPRLRAYRPGECLHLDLPSLGLNTDAIILRRNIDPATMKVTLELMGETPAKHAYCLGQIGVAPPTPSIGQTAQERDELAAAALDPLTVVLSEVAPFDVQLDQLGAVATVLPISRIIKLFKGGTQQTTGVTVSSVSTTAGIVASTSVSSGEVTVNLDEANVNGVVIVRIDFESTTYEKSIIVTRLVGTTTGGGAGGVFFVDSSWTNISTTTDTQVTDSGAVVQSDASGQLRYSASALYYGSGVAIITAQYSPDGSTWTDFEPSTTGSVAGVISGEVIEGYVSIDATTETGLTASTDYFVRLLARRSTGSGTLSWSSANFTVQQP